MISITLHTKRTLFSFLEKAYPVGDTSKSFSGTSASEIISFFSGTDCDTWQVIDYEGTAEDITEHMSLLSTRFFSRYFLALTLPQNGNIESATKVHNKVEVSNLCKITDPMFSMCLDDTLADDKVIFRLVAPRYTYTDVWEQRNK